ncbi:biotin transporter BioY [Polycladidibacter hongkongensis]|uniref:biotin transporter BioY n=1 Tax=Polycladidibacter hongkongensis TaxID=1647556 RepID=UPI000833CEC8|nr:biotin transporter BioY [Pseudovibrio hongkongensis]
MALSYASNSLSLSARVTRVLAMVAILSLSAKLQVPFWPVPMTMQTAAVFALAAIMGPQLAVQGFVAYLLAGAVGLPVFAGTPEKGIGLAYMVGPTGGYLLGFLLATILASFAASKGRLHLALSMLAGLALVYLFGLIWLANWVPSDKLLAVGMTQFILGDLVKLTLAFTLAVALPSRLTQRLQGKTGTDV